MLGCLGNHDIRRMNVRVWCVCVLVGNPLAPPPCASSRGAKRRPCLHSHHPFCTWNYFAVTWSDHGLLVIDHFLWVSSFDGRGVWKFAQGHLECDQRLCEPFSIPSPALLMGTVVVPSNLAAAAPG